MVYEIDDNKTAYYGLPVKRNVLYNIDKRILCSGANERLAEMIPDGDGKILRKERSGAVDKGDEFIALAMEFFTKSIFFQNKPPAIFRYRLDGTVSVVLVDVENEDHKVSVNECVGRYKRDYTVWLDFLDYCSHSDFILLVEREDKVWQAIVE